jgi:hypothetical protein
MVNTSVLLGVFNDHHVFYILHNTNGGMITAAIGADRTNIFVTDIPADTAESQFSAQPDDGIAEQFQ